MLGSALYYPFMDIRDRGWLRSAILFWDDIQTIVPTTIEKPYQNPDTEICATEGYLRPLRVDLYPKLLEALSEQIMLLMSSEPDWLTNLIDSVPQGRNPSVELLRKSRQLQKKFGKGYREPELISPSERRAMEALHRLKLGRPLQEKLRRADTKGDWVLVNSRFADLYMTALAGIFAKEKNVSALTHKADFQGLNIRQCLDVMHFVDQADAHRTKGTLVTVVMESLRVDPDVPIQKLLAFRRRRSDQLAELSAMFDDLTSKIAKSEEKRELKEKAARVYENNIRPGLQKLKDELSDESIKSLWQGFAQGATVSVGAGSALATFTVAPGSIVLGAGAFLAVATVAINTLFARRKARRASPYSYLLDIERRFSMPRHT